MQLTFVNKIVFPMKLFCAFLNFYSFYSSSVINNFLSGRALTNSYNYLRDMKKKDEENFQYKIRFTSKGTCQCWWLSLVVSRDKHPQGE